MSLAPNLHARESSRTEARITLIQAEIVTFAVLHRNRRDRVGKVKPDKHERSTSCGWRIGDRQRSAASRTGVFSLSDFCDGARSSDLNRHRSDVAADRTVERLESETVGTSEVSIRSINEARCGAGQGAVGGLRYNRIS